MLPTAWKTRNNLDDFVEQFFYGRPNYRRDENALWSPRVDINENDDAFTIDVELPGVDKEAIKVDVKDNVLTVSGERTNTREAKEGCYSSVERHYGKFERAFTVPKTVDIEKISATTKNGVMTLSLPKTEKAKPREITVDVK